MINRTQIKSLLKINGVPDTSPDEEIRSVLLSARYSNDEVDTAIMVLREDTKTNKTRVDGLHKIFRTDQALKPEEISQLLGIQVDLTNLPDQQTKSKTISGVYFVFIWMLSIIVALGGVLLYMYMYKIGVFHPSVGLAFFDEL